MDSHLSPRCLVCDTALSGPISPVFRVVGITRSTRNPNICNRCDTHLQEAEIVELTVFFADLTSFTQMTNELGPERTYQVIDAYFQMANQVLVRHDAYIDKYIGDAVMAIFNAPIHSESHARKAVAAALDIQHGLVPLREQLGLDLKVRIGIATGYARVGRVGSTDRKDYTAIGDVVNLASRLEAQAQPGEILVDAQVYQQIADDFPGILAERLEIKGFKDPVPTHRIGSHSVASRSVEVTDAYEDTGTPRMVSLGATLFAILGAPCAATAILGPLSLAVGAGALMGSLAPFLTTLDRPAIRLPLQAVALVGALANLFVIWYGFGRRQRDINAGNGVLTLTRLERRKVILVAGLAILTLVVMVAEIYSHVFIMGETLI
jgi:adenylate cyclase